jgi:hypothetical protein
LADAILRARQGLEIGDWEMAMRESLDALQLDPDSTEAMDLFDRAYQLLGGGAGGVAARQMSP